jgi:4-amino-4-deoxy-L-arabinose transferase-like glycosyltransferase
MKMNLLNSSFISQLSNTDRLNILAIIAIWLFLVILVNPLGDFPMIDDWVYGLAVKSILEKGDFQLPSPASANVFAQAFWGALFCLPFGFSFTALRFSTLTLGLIGVLVTYAILREINASPKISLFGALSMAVNPVYFGLSNTFMTDVPFYTFFVLSFYCLIRGLKRDSNFAIVIGIATSYIAVLIRQIGLVIPLAFSGAYLFKKGINLQNLTKAFIPIVLGLFIQFFYRKWLYITGRTPTLQNPQYKHFSESLFNLSISFVKNFSHNILFILIYIGAFIFPLLIVLFLNKFKEVASQSKKKLIIFTLSAFLVSVMGWLILRYKRLMPLLCCHLDFNFGFGPLFHLRQPSNPLLGSLKHGKLWLFESPAIPLSLKAFWLFMTAIGIVGAALLLLNSGFDKLSINNDID